MPREVLLPELAESVVEGEIVKWLVAEGDEVAQDQPIVEVMTDKVTVELPSPFAGVLEKRLAQEGEVVAVHAPIARFADEGGKASSAPDKKDTPSVQAGEERSIVEPGGVAEEDDGSSLSLFKPSDMTESGPVFQVKRQGVARPAPPEPQPPAKVTGPYGRVLAVPAARKLARELGVEIETVEGSGPNGRIRLDDVRAHAESAAQGVARGGVAQPTALAYKTPQGMADLEERLPVRGLRRAISQQMMASHLGSVRTLHVDEADLTELVALRERLKPIAEKRGVKLSYLPFIIKAVVAALRRFPMLNASLDEEKNEIVRKRYYNIGMAVATDAGLVVPVIQHADQKSILDIAQDITHLAEKARAGKLAGEDVRGGTFSVTNIGTLGGLFSFPIINVPEAAILGVHSIKKRPVVLPDDTVGVRRMIYLSLSFDHRLVDGAEAAMFTSALIEMLETPESLMLER